MSSYTGCSGKKIPTGGAFDDGSSLDEFLQCFGDMGYERSEWWSYRGWDTYSFQPYHEDLQRSL